MIALQIQCAKLFSSLDVNKQTQLHKLPVFMQFKSLVRVIENK